MAGLGTERKAPSEGRIGLWDYHVSKHGIVAFSSYMAKDLGHYGIQVTAVCPGAVRTPWWEGRFPGDIENILTTENITDLVSFLIKQPDNVLYKMLSVLPVCEV